jgi:hypothetical protein
MQCQLQERNAYGEVSIYYMPFAIPVEMVPNVLVGHKTYIRVFVMLCKNGPLGHRVLIRLVGWAGAVAMTPGCQKTVKGPLR